MCLLSEPPFHLTRRGWGEFPVRIQIHFKDPRNKRIDIIHQLKVRPQHHSAVFLLFRLRHGVFPHAVLTDTVIDVLMCLYCY